MLVPLIAADASCIGHCFPTSSLLLRDDTVSHGFSHRLRCHSTTSHTKVSIKKPEAPKMIYQIGHFHKASYRLGKTGHWSVAATAATITASRWKGQKLWARQTGNQKHSETLLAQGAENGKPWNLEDTPAKTGHKEWQEFPSLDCQKLRTFAAIERLYFAIEHIQAFQADYRIAIFPPKLWQW